MKNLVQVKNVISSNEQIMKLIKLYKFMGKDFYYEEIMKSDMVSIMRQTVEKECYEIYKYLDLKMTDNRKNLIIRKDGIPRASENDEKLLANLKLVFEKIVADPYNFEFITNEVFNLAKYIYRDVKNIEFSKVKKKRVINLLTETYQASKRDELKELLDRYQTLLRSGDYEITNLVVNFYIDFIHMNIFNYGNELIGIILLYSLLFREKFNLFKYTSFFELLNEKKDLFKQAVLKADFNYEDGFSNTTALSELIVDMLIEGYQKVESMIHEYTFDVTLNKSDNIENTISKLPQIFTKDDIRAKHPLTSDSTINRTLQRLRDQGKIRPNGTGRSATWIKLIEEDNFNANFAQINLFEVQEDPEEKK